jgi:hypothetical protein
MKRCFIKSKAGILLLPIAVISVLLVSGMAAAEGGLSAGQTVYVPIYSHIYSGDREHPFLLTAILSIRNTDPIHTITVTTIDYYDTAGTLLERYIEKPIRLKPMSSTRYVVPESDKSGGSGAKFIVEWEAVSPINPPIIEGIMIGAKMQQGISFVTRGQVITAPGK